jgi:hypothetical protein
MKQAMLLSKLVKQRREDYSIPPYASGYVPSNSLRRDAARPCGLGSIAFRPEPHDIIVERRCKRAWEQAPCPECGDTVLQTRDAGSYGR